MPYQRRLKSACPHDREEMPEVSHRAEAGATARCHTLELLRRALQPGCGSSSALFYLVDRAARGRSSRSAEWFPQRECRPRRGMMSGAADVTASRMPFCQTPAAGK